MSEPKRLYDLAVIGAGPSGASAAHVAAEAGLSTLVLDAASFPRVKPCGGGLSEQAMSYLNSPVPEHLQEADVFGARVHLLGKTVTARLSDRIATIVSRHRFDAFLLDRARGAGCDVREGERVRAVTQHDDRVELASDDRVYSARYCVIAAGAANPLAQHVRPAPVKSDYALAVEIDLKAPNQIVHDYADGLVDIFFGVAKLGYGWVFPHDERFNVGLAGIADRLTKPPRRLDAFVETLPETVRSRADAGTNRVGFPIPAGGRRTRIARGRVLLAGDSAGFVDSFYGEGIAYAIRSGQLAAEAVASSPKPATTYTKWCYNEIVPALRYSLIFAHILHRYPNVLLKVFATTPAVLEHFLRVPARQWTYVQFMRWFLPRVPIMLMKRSQRAG